MTELYLVFLAMAVVLFAAIVAYSYYKKRSGDAGSAFIDGDSSYVDPLVAELEKRNTQTQRASQAERANPADEGEQDISLSASAHEVESKSTGPAQGSDASRNAVDQSKREAESTSLKPGQKPTATAQSVTREEPTANQAGAAASAISKVAKSTTAGVKERVKQRMAPRLRSAKAGTPARADELKSDAGLGTEVDTGVAGTADTKAGTPGRDLSGSAAPGLPPSGNSISSTQRGSAAKLQARSSMPKASDGPLQLDAGSNIITELVAKVKNPEPIEQQELLKLFRNHDYKFHRKVHIYGLNELTDLWRDIEFELPSARFVELGVAIQLADRDGAMSNKELHDFQQMALDFTNSFNAPFEFSMDIDEAQKQAARLDELGRRYDSMAVLNVVPRSKAGFRMADIESCARDLMMSTDKNGIFVKTRGQKQALTVLYRLACTDGSGHFGVSNGAMAAVHDLVIYMNVPATPEPDRVFQDMVKDANSLATWLDGKVVDRGGKVMTQRSYSVLLQQISDITYSMQQDGITAGDAVSKKLF